MRSCAQPHLLRERGGAQRALDHRLAQHLLRVLPPGRGQRRVGVHHLREQRLVERAPVHADAHRLPVRIACSTMVVKLASRCLVPTLPGLIRYLASASRALRVAGEEQVPVVVEVAHDRHGHAARARAPRRCRGTAFAASSLFTVTRTSSLPGAPERRHLPDRGLHVGGVGVGHRLHDHRVAAADLHPAHVHRDAPSCARMPVMGSGGSRSPRWIAREINSDRGARESGRPGAMSETDAQHLTGSTPWRDSAGSQLRDAAMRPGRARRRAKAAGRCRRRSTRRASRRDERPRPRSAPAADPGFEASRFRRTHRQPRHPPGPGAQRAALPRSRRVRRATPKARLPVDCRVAATAGRQRGADAEEGGAPARRPPSPAPAALPCAAAASAASRSGSPTAPPLPARAAPPSRRDGCASRRTGSERSGRYPEPVAWSTATECRRRARLPGADDSVRRGRRAPARATEEGRRGPPSASSRFGSRRPRTLASPAEGGHLLEGAAPAPGVRSASV